MRFNFEFKIRFLPVKICCADNILFFSITRAAGMIFNQKSVNQVLKKEV